MSEGNRPDKSITLDQKQITPETDGVIVQTKKSQVKAAKSVYNNSYGCQYYFV